jgi:hypothetical protein
MRTKASLALLASAVLLTAADYPTAEISNGVVKATVLLPDKDKGYYQGTRFDWSGAISSLEYKGHQYFGKWFDRYDPKTHDAIQGPVEEFLTAGKGLGYDETKAGENFVKIGIGAIKKPEERAFRQFNTYDIADYGKWTVKTGPDYIEFKQVLGDTNGYAYEYTKTVRLLAGKPELVLEHALKNTGKKTIESAVYEHNFFMLDGQPSGPDIVVKFPWTVTNLRDLHGLAEPRGNDFAYLKELQPRQSIMTEFTGYKATPKDYDIRVENTKSGAGVRQTSDRPLAKMLLWSINTTVCPEAYIDLKVDPGKETTWKINYEFYTLDKK